MRTRIPSMLRHLLAGIAIGLWCAALAHGAAGALPRSSPVPGGVVVLRLGDAMAEPPRAWFQERRVLVLRRPSGWHAVVGLPLALPPERHALEIADGPAGKRVETFEVRDKKYPVQHVRIKDRRKVTPEPEDLERIEREQRIIAAVKSLWGDEAEVDAALQLPADGALSSRFGLRRIFNGEARQPHSGLDVALASGTPVRSSGPGRVVNTGDYFFNGQTVFVDHGQGLITMYCHLSRVDVRTGDAVGRGKQIGLSGMSGRASGPHLHWSVMLNGTAVDPELFLSAPHQP